MNQTTAMIPVQGGYVPRFSLAERDRRWNRVRELMAADNIDCIFVPPNTGHWDTFQASGRYLTTIGGNNAQVATIFPFDGDVTAISSPDINPAIWHARTDWVDDIRSAGSGGGWGYTEHVIARIKELGLERGRIGIVGLEGNTRYPEGVFSHGMYEKLRATLPQAEFVNGNFVLERARFAKSGEEIAMMERGIELAEGALDVLRAEAKPGVPECVVYMRLLSSMVERGAELPSMILWSAAWPQSPSNYYMPTQRPLQRGDMISIELEARVAGYNGQVTQVAFIGEAPREYQEMFELQQRAVARCYELLHPGSIMGDFVEAVKEFETADYTCRLIMHCRGLGDDSPICIGEFRDEMMRTWPIETGATFIIKPVIFARKEFRRLYWGDTVAATANGARRLGSRKPEIMQL
jgi:Xaa-Pro dipeptidase